MARVATLLLNGDMWWSLSPSDPVAIALSSLPGCQVVNPLAFAATSQGPQIIPFSAERCYLLSNQLTIRSPDTEIPQEEFPTMCSAFLRTLRLVTKQSALPTELFGI